MSRPQSGSAQLCWAWWHSGNASADLLISSRHSTKHVWATPLTPTDRWGLCWNTCTKLNLLMLLSHGPSLAQGVPEPQSHSRGSTCRGMSPPTGHSRAGSCDHLHVTPVPNPRATERGTGAAQDWTLPLAPHAQTGAHCNAEFRKHTSEIF